MPPWTGGAGRTDMAAEVRDSEIAAHNLGIAAEMHRVVRALNAASIPSIVLKGVPLCERIGEGLAHRALVDNDILVRRAHMPRAMEALGRLGYRSLPWRSVEQDIDDSFEHPLSRPDVDGRPLFCELHWNAFPPILFTASEATLWRRTEELEVFGGAVRVFEPTLQLLHLASHVIQHDLCEPRTLEVFGRAFTRWHGEVDGSELTELADELGIRPAFTYVLATARALGFTTVDGAATASFRVAVAQRLMRPERLLEPADDRYPERYFRAVIVLLLVSPERALRQLLARMLPPPEHLVRRRGRRAVAFHYLSRPFRPLARSATTSSSLQRALAVRHYLRVYRSLNARFRDSALDELLRDLEAEPRSARPLSVDELARAIRTAERLAPRLSDTPNTCLYRALSRYALLGSHAHRASFVLGVATRADDPGHAWIEISGEPFLEVNTPRFNRVLVRESPA